MPDVYASITEAERAVQERLADVMELRAADPRYQAMLRSYLAEIDFAPGAEVLEIGCGSGSVTRLLARWPNVAQAVGVDPSEVFVERARTLAHEIANIEFRQADGRALPLESETFDAVVINTTLSHVPEPERLVQQAFRVLRPAGWLAIFDGDYSTATVARSEFDPLEACIGAFRTHFVHDAWIVRRLPVLVASAGFDVISIRSHGYVEAPQGAYMLTWIDRGADVLTQSGCIGAQSAAALKAEAQRRHAESQWFGHIAFASVVARKGASVPARPAARAT